MSGHSKWSTIKHKKALIDSKRGKIFTKLIREITTSVREGGGGDIAANPRLRLAVLQAKQQNMGQDTIQRAIIKGEGNKGGEQFERITYEGYGPHGIAVIVETLTDNRNRTASSIRYVFSKHDGNLGSTNAVQHLFVHKGVFTVPTSVAADEDSLTEIALEAGVDDLEQAEENYVLFCPLTAFDAVRQALDGKSIAIEQAQLAWLPLNEMAFEEPDKVKKITQFIDALENDDDVQQVFFNCILPDDAVETE